MSNKKGSWLIALVVILIIMQAFSVSRIKSMEREMENLGNQMRFFSDNDRNYLDNISYQIQQQLDKQASIIDNFDYSFGSLDVNSLTMDCIFTVFPKQLEDDTRAGLELNGKMMQMERREDSFVLTASLGLFDTVAQPRLVLESDGVRRQESLDMRFDVRYEALPTMWASLDRQGDVTTSRTGGDHSVTYFLSGNLRLGTVEQTPPGTNSGGLTNIRLAVAIDGEEIFQRPAADFPNDGNVNGNRGTEKFYVLTISEELDFSLLPGQDLQVMVQGEDQCGITHQVIVDQLTVDTNGEPNWNESSLIVGEETLLDSAGNILWRPSE